MEAKQRVPAPETGNPRLPPLSASVMWMLVAPVAQKARRWPSRSRESGECRINRDPALGRIALRLVPCAPKEVLNLSDLRQDGYRPVRPLLRSARPRRKTVEDDGDLCLACSFFPIWECHLASFCQIKS
jgi:hypothetical protein